VALDTVTLDMSIRTITSEKTVNIYGGWNRDYLSLETGGNSITAVLLNANNQVVENTNLSVEYIYQPVRYL
jgi:hypothetical protein